METDLNIYACGLMDDIEPVVELKTDLIPRSGHYDWYKCIFSDGVFVENCYYQVESVKGRSVFMKYVDDDLTTLLYSSVPLIDFSSRFKLYKGL